MHRFFHHFAMVLTGFVLPFALPCSAQGQGQPKVGEKVVIGSGSSFEVGIVRSVEAQSVQVEPVVSFIRFGMPVTRGIKTVSLNQIYQESETNANLLNKLVRIQMRLEGRVVGSFGENFLWLRGLDDTSIVIDHTRSAVAVELSSYENIQHGSKVSWKENGRVVSGIVDVVYSDGMVKIVPQTIGDQRIRFIVWDHLTIRDACPL